MSAQIPRATMRPRKRPPLRSYIPFTLFCATCLSLLLGLVLVVGHLTAAAPPHRLALAENHVPAATAQEAAPARTPVVTSHPAHRAAVRPGRALYGPPLLPVRPAGTASATLQTSGMPAPAATAVASAAPPLATPTPTATPDGNATVVIARNVDNNGNPLLPSTRFLSPALRLYAVVTLGTVNPTDVLRFVFERNGRVLPNDVISYAAGGTASSHNFNAYADYHNGSEPLPHGHYRLLFYRNGRLEAVAQFEVG